MKSHDFETERDKREWDLQESALREERAGARTDSRTAARQNADVGIYRLVIRALKAPRLDPLPRDFAVLTAARVEAESGADRVESWLERGLVVLLVLVGAAAVLSYNVESLSLSIESLRAFLAAVPRPTDFALPSYAVWGLAIASCVALTWLLESWQKWKRA
jgi:hypothetical protein